MAKNEVRIPVIIDDKGSMKQTAKGAHSVDRRTKGAAKASSNASKNFSKISSCTWVPILLNSSGVKYPLCSLFSILKTVVYTVFTFIAILIFLKKKGGEIPPYFIVTCYLSFFSIDL